MSDEQNLPRAGWAHWAETIRLHNKGIAGAPMFRSHGFLTRCIYDGDDPRPEWRKQSCTWVSKYELER